MNNELIIAVLGAALGGGTVVAAIIEAIRALVGWRLKRKAAIEDREAAKEEKKIEERLEHIEKHQEEIDEQIRQVVESISIQKETNMFVLYDRLKYLARCFIKDGEISLEDRDTWNAMHDCYHKNGGNGNLDHLSEYINKLQIKTI